MSKMTYTVREISKTVFASFPYDKALLSHSYPIPGNENISPDGVTRFHNCLGLYKLDDLPELQKTTFFSYLFGEKYTHCIILAQLKELHAVVWILCETASEPDGREAFTMIYQTLLPLLHNGVVFLSETLLDAIIVPSPAPPDKLSTIILEMMECNPCSHPDWSSVVRGLTDSTAQESLFEKGGNICKPNAIGITPYDTASNHTNCAQRLKNALQIEPQGSSTMPRLCFDSVDLHITARENKSDVIRKALISKVSIESIPEYTDGENSPSSCQQEVFDIDVIDVKSQDTPLYVSVQKEYIKSSLFFLLGGANPNFVHPVSGDTCLHLAARQGSIILIKLLLIFYADPTIQNSNRKTPLDLLPHIPEYDKIMSMFQEIENLDKEYKLLPTDAVKLTPNEGQFLLSFDGGGSRCISEVQILIAIEKRMKELNPNCKPFISHFDYVAGTSGGAFHALVLVYNKATLKNDRALNVNGATYSDCSSMYEKTKNVERLIKNTLGEVRVMADVATPRCIVTGTLANTIPPKLHLVTNYGEPRDGQLGPKERKIWEAARISSAAPTYLMSYDNFIDGGMMANNPTVDAIVEMNDQSMKENNQPLKLSCVLSLGSGQTKPIDIKNIDVCGRSYGITGFAEKVDGYKNLMTIIISQVTQAEGQDIGRAKTLCDMSGGVYYRLVAPVDVVIPLDTSNPIDLIQPMFDSFMFTCRNSQLVDSIARMLLSNPRLHKETMHQ